jgi:hypothetical protein
MTAVGMGTALGKGSQKVNYTTAMQLQLPTCLWRIFGSKSSTFFSSFVSLSLAAVKFFLLPAVFLFLWRAPAFPQTHKKKIYIYINLKNSKTRRIFTVTGFFLYIYFFLFFYPKLISSFFLFLFLKKKFISELSLLIFLNIKLVENLTM